MRLVFAALLLVVVGASPAAAKPKHWHQDKHWSGDDYGRSRGRGAKCYVAPEEIRVVREYYAPRYRALPPGLAKKYYRTGHLPPGWAKKVEPLPADLERRLDPLPAGYRRGYLDGALVVFAPTQVVIDLVPLFGR